jgi:hypothetical protein
MPGKSATVEVSSVESGTVLRITGPLEAGDDKRLIRHLLEADKPVVSFSSPGGSLLVGLNIGRALRLQGVTTVVEDDQTCASACGLAWLGGSRRMMGSTARVGFHAAYFIDDDGKAIETGSGNALIGAYLSQIGMNDDAIYYITRSSPASMQWLTADDALSLGIHLQIFGAPIAPSAQPPKAIEDTPCRVADVRPPDAWLALRSEPSARSGRQLRRLLPGQTFEMLGEQRDEWYRVRLPDGLHGWVSWEVRRWIAC